MALTCIWGGSLRGMGVSCRQLWGSFVFTVPSARPCARPSGQTSIHKCLWSERLNKQRRAGHLIQTWGAWTLLECAQTCLMLQELLTFGDVAVTSKETPVPFSAGSLQGCAAGQLAQPSLPVTCNFQTRYDIPIGTRNKTGCQREMSDEAPFHVNELKPDGKRLGQ
ncbi:uncharacterized protein ACOB8E_012242 isoform 2-T2 [Sarcophilus harrisii]